MVDPPALLAQTRERLRGGFSHQKLGRTLLLLLRSIVDSSIAGTELRITPVSTLSRTLPYRTWSPWTFLLYRLSPLLVCELIFSPVLLILFVLALVHALSSWAKSNASEARLFLISGLY